MTGRIGWSVGRAKLEPVRSHDLRHTFAALMVDAGAYPKPSQAQMGDTSIAITLDLYGHLYPDCSRMSASSSTSSSTRV